MDYVDSLAKYIEEIDAELEKLQSKQNLDNLELMETMDTRLKPLAKRLAQRIRRNKEESEPEELNSTLLTKTGMISKHELELRRGLK